MEESNVKVLDDLISSIDDDWEVEEIVLGTKFNLVKSRGYGLSSTLGERYHGSISAKSAKDLAKLAYSKNIGEASVGLAAINSLIKLREERLVDINAKELILKLSQGKKVSLIGHFPFVEELKIVAANLWVIEMRPKEGDYPEDAKDEFVPASDVVAISGTTLINHTFESIIRICKPEAKKIVLGPSTPLSEVLFEYGVDVVSGVVVRKGRELRELIEKGKNFREIKRSGYVSLATLLKDQKLI